MRWEVLTLALMLVVAEPASAAVPVRDCDSRGEGQRPIRRLVDRGDLQIGPVAFVGLARLADPSRFGRVGESRNGRVLLKTPDRLRQNGLVRHGPGRRQLRQDLTASRPARTRRRGADLPRR